MSDVRFVSGKVPDMSEFVLRNGCSRSYFRFVSRVLPNLAVFLPRNAHGGSYFRFAVATNRKRQTANYKREACSRNREAANYKREACSRNQDAANIEQTRNQQGTAPQPLSEPQESHFGADAEFCGADEEEPLGEEVAYQDEVVAVWDGLDEFVPGEDEV